MDINNPTVKHLDFYDVSYKPFTNKELLRITLVSLKSLKMNCHGLFATKVIPKQCGTNVSHNLYNKQIKLSFSLKNCIINRGV